MEILMEDNLFRQILKVVIVSLPFVSSYQACRNCFVEIRGGVWECMLFLQHQTYANLYSV